MRGAGLLRAIMLGAGLGLITSALSELFFYPIHIENAAELSVYYMFMALFAFAAVERSGRFDLAAVVLGASLFGWTVEGVLVNQSYEAMPSSLVWVALAWHGVMTVGLGLFGLRMAFLAGRPWVPGIAAALFGLAAGLWGVYGWTALMEPEMAATIGHDFGMQTLIMTAMIVLGFLLLDYAPTRAPVPGAVFWVLVAAAIFIWGISWALPLFPLSLAVPVLMGLTGWALWRRRVPGAEGGPRALPMGRVALPRYLWFLLVPVLAIPVQEALVVDPGELIAELNIFVLIPTFLASVLLWPWAIYRGWRRR